MIRPLYLNLSETAAALSMSESGVQTAVREDPEFPKPRKLSKGRVGYLLREIEAWAESRPVSDLPPPPNTGARKGRKFPKETQNSSATAA